MGNVQIVSSLKNKENQKNAVHKSSSAVFFAVSSGDGSIDTEISMLNHFILKRGISDVIATIEYRDPSGKLIKDFKLSMEEPRVYSIRASQYVKGPFIGSIYIFFNSNENLAVPFCAVMSAINTKNSICGVHTYGRRLERKEIGGLLDLQNTVEQGWTARDTQHIKSFAILHGGSKKLDLDIALVISNSLNETLQIQYSHTLQPYGTAIIIPQELSNNVISHLNGEKGTIKVHVDGISGIFPRMLCGNFSSEEQLSGSFQDAIEIQFTHSNFDFSFVNQPDSNSKIGYFTQPAVPNGYGVVYPVDTDKNIIIGGKEYLNNSAHHIRIKSMDKVEILAKETNLPSRFLAATLAKWDGATLESECSTGIFIEDYLSVPCHWHWGLLKPGLTEGEGVISIFRNNFGSDDQPPHLLKLQVYNETELILENIISIAGDQTINVMEMLPTNSQAGPLWYVLTGDKLEDLNIFSTFYPPEKAGFVEHAF